MIEFILNNDLIKASGNAGGSLLDFVRYERSLVGTKIGCREGDCGACTLLIGTLDKDGELQYKSITSCISPLGNAHGKHVVSVEGLNAEAGLRPYQQAMVDESASQCGFCTVGFVMSFAGACLEDTKATQVSMIGAVDGNICRCTGYKSIERAAGQVAEGLEQKPSRDALQWLIQNNYIPDYFDSIAQRLQQIKTQKVERGDQILGGGTDLLVQRHDQVYESKVHLISDHDEMTGIFVDESTCVIGGATITTELLHSAVFHDMIPNWKSFIKLVSSTPIRNMATVAGNLVNASPIGDLTSIFLALNSNIQLQDSQNNKRTLPLKEFYLGYKQLDKKDDEIIIQLAFNVLSDYGYFNFEKISKRTYLDIASVNTSISLEVQENKIMSIHASAGGVGPIPIYLQNTCDFLEGRNLTYQAVLEALEILDEDISPIGDVRGSKEYKAFMLKQLFYGHFIELFPESFSITQLMQNSEN